MDSVWQYVKQVVKSFKAIVEESGQRQNIVGEGLPSPIGPDNHKRNDG